MPGMVLSQHFTHTAISLLTRQAHELLLKARKQSPERLRRSSEARRGTRGSDLKPGHLGRLVFHTHHPSVCLWSVLPTHVSFLSFLAFVDLLLKAKTPFPNNVLSTQNHLFCTKRKLHENRGVCVLFPAWPSVPRIFPVHSTCSMSRHQAKSWMDLLSHQQGLLWGSVVNQLPRPRPRWQRNCSPWYWSVRACQHLVKCHFRFLSPNLLFPYKI